MDTLATNRVPDGMLVASFAGTVVAVDPATGRHHILDQAGAWQPAMDTAVSTTGVAADMPAGERDGQPGRAHSPAGVAIIRAGAVRTPDGRVMMLVGPPGAGKSTLTAALVAAGCDLLGDDTIGVAPDGTLTATPDALDLDAAARQTLGLAATTHLRTDPHELRAGVTLVTTAVGTDEILVVAYDPDHTGMMSARPLEPEAALGAVLAEVTNLAATGPDGLAAVCHLVESVPVVPFTHAGANRAVPVILGI